MSSARRKTGNFLCFCPPLEKCLHGAIQAKHLTELLLTVITSAAWLLRVRTLQAVTGDILPVVAAPGATVLLGSSEDTAINNNYKILLCCLAIERHVF